MRNHIKELLLALARTRIELVVCGGVAAVLHGIERVTLDLDLSVRMAPDNLRRFLTVMKEQGLRPRVPVPPEALLDPVQVRAMVKEKHAIVFTFIDPDDPLRQVDLFLTDELRYEHLIADAVPVTISEQTIHVASPRQLLAQKRAVQPPRPRDLHDIAELERLLGES